MILWDKGTWKLSLVHGVRVPLDGKLITYYSYCIFSKKKLILNYEGHRADSGTTINQ